MIVLGSMYRLGGMKHHVWLRSSVSCFLICDLISEAIASLLPLLAEGSDSREDAIVSRVPPGWWPGPSPHTLLHGEPGRADNARWWRVVFSYWWRVEGSIDAEPGRWTGLVDDVHLLSDGPHSPQCAGQALNFYVQKFWILKFLPFKTNQNVRRKHGPWIF